MIVTEAAGINMFQKQSALKLNIKVNTRYEIMWIYVVLGVSKGIRMILGIYASYKIKNIYNKEGRLPTNSCFFGTP